MLHGPRSLQELREFGPGFNSLGGRVVVLRAVVVLDAIVGNRANVDGDAVVAVIVETVKVVIRFAVETDNIDVVELRLRGHFVEDGYGSGVKFTRFESR